MDIDLAIEELGKAANRYRHDGTQIIYWDPANADAQPTPAELASVEVAADAALSKLKLNHVRVNAYPSIGDQLDMLWHAVDTGDWTAAKVKTTEFYTALKAVKDANPKP